MVLRCPYEPYDTGWMHLKSYICYATIAMLEVFEVWVRLLKSMIRGAKTTFECTCLGMHYVLTDTTTYICNQISNYGNTWYEGNKFHHWEQNGFHKHRPHRKHDDYDAEIDNLESDTEDPKVKNPNIWENSEMTVHQINETNTIKKKALNYLMFIKQKRYCKIKARGCVDGRP